jgi:hypothetical protein
MDHTTNDILCTKSRLWKRGTLVQSLIDELIDRGYTFVELVLGEPDHFTFADHYDEIAPLFRQRGFYGIRLKMKKGDAVLAINANTGGVDNVQYAIFAPDPSSHDAIQADIDWIRTFLGPSSEWMARTSEYLSRHRRLTSTILLVLIGIALYLLGVHVFLFNLVGILFSFSPFLALYILFLLFRRRR